MIRSTRYVVAIAALAAALPHIAGAQNLRHARRTMNFEFAESADSLFVLFGPTREGEWAPGWKPTFMVAADSAQTSEGAVFTTPAGHGGQRVAYWVMNEYDVVARRVRYVRIVPEMTAIQLDITVTPTARSSGRVEATYTYTALTEKGNDAVEAFANDITAVRAHWDRAINDYLARRATRRPAGSPGKP